MAIIISPSLLGYEENLKQREQHIQQILSTGIKQLHIDIMRDPFIPKRDTFSEDGIKWLYNNFGNKANFDFHLMVDEPDKLIETIDAIVLPSDRGHTNITVHREAYRDRSPLARGGLGMYADKEYDLLVYKTGRDVFDQRLRDDNKLSGDCVYATLEHLKEAGYQTGLALEPKLSLANITDEMLSKMDMLLLMTVRSGEGKQPYMNEVTPKIEAAHKRYPALTIQVDGGINEATIPIILQAGATNMVIGSYITNAENIANRIISIQEQTRKI